MMMLLACAPDSAFGRFLMRRSGLLEPVERLDRTVGARRETVQVAVGCDVERIGEPSVVAFAFLCQMLQDRVRGFRGRLPFLGRVIARFRKSGQTAGEPFLDDLAWQLAGERVERGAQQRDVQHGIAAVIVIVFLDLRKKLLQTGKFFAQHFVLQHIPGIGVVGHGIE